MTYMGLHRWHGGVEGGPRGRGYMHTYLGWEDPLEKGMATHSSILAWRSPWTEEPEGYSPWGPEESDVTEADLVACSRSQSNTLFSQRKPILLMRFEIWQAWVQISVVIQCDVGQITYCVHKMGIMTSTVDLRIKSDKQSWICVWNIRDAQEKRIATIT